MQPLRFSKPTEAKTPHAKRLEAFYAAITDLESFCRVTNQNNRSAFRTDALNRIMYDYIVSANPSLKQYDAHYEASIDGDGRDGTFKCDITLTCKTTNKIKVVILLKAINSSYQKNGHSYTNTTFGEGGDRVGCSPHFDPWDEETKIVFVNLMPRIAPVFGGDKSKVTSYEDLTRIKKTFDLTESLKKCAWIHDNFNHGDVNSPRPIRYIEKIKVIDLFYSIDDVHNKTHRNDFLTNTITDLDPMPVIQ